jgi:N-carbamoyl-L-amino-acid hydrolase
VAQERPGVVLGSHLDSVPDGGAFDGPLGIISAFVALDALRDKGYQPSRPIGVVNFGDEEGARFGIACAGSRIITGALPADQALALTDSDAVSMSEAIRRAGGDPSELGRDEETLRRVGVFIELHVEQGRGLIDLDRPVAVGSAIWPHGRWRFDLPGKANHAGTTRLADRHDPMLALADVIQQTRGLAERFGVLGTCGKVQVEPNAVNAIPSRVTGWLDARGADPGYVQAFVEALDDVVGGHGGSMRQESWTHETLLDLALAERLAGLLSDAPVLPTGAGHDAGILANAGIRTAMLFVRNPTGVSHSPAEHADRDDCLLGVAALATVVEDLAVE